MKKLMVTLLAGTIITMCFSGTIPVLGQEASDTLQIWSTLREYEEATGKKIEKFAEAPMLEVQVAAGEILAIDQRLPEQPFVVEPAEEIGQYGGVLNAGALGVIGTEDPFYIGCQLTFDPTPDWSRTIPSIFESYEYSEDMRTLTIYLRKGMKWSDGVSFTTEDVLFWYEDILKNENLTSAPPGIFKPGDELAELEVVDNYTFCLHFAVPARLTLAMAHWMNSLHSLGMYAPKHYLKKWHIKYNPKADELAKEEGHENWWGAFTYHSFILVQDPNAPSFNPWVLKEMTPTLVIYERNPYYYKVDTAGNQLPYIDEVVSNIVGDNEALNLKLISGELDIGALSLSLENYPLYKENEKKGNYRVLLWQSSNGQDCAFSFNLTHKDPVLRKIFQDVRFRRAMSLAIDRDEINEVLYYGRSVPRQATVIPSTSFYKEEWARAYAQYDPETANALLDEMGLKWDKDHKWRLRPDGTILAVTIEYHPIIGVITSSCELVKEYWQAVGMKVDLKMISWDLYEVHGHANELDVGVWLQDSNTEDYLYASNGGMFSPADTMELHYCTEWSTWFNTDGEKGEEPPEEVKELHQWWKDWQVAVNKEEYIRLAQKIFDFHAKNVWMVGTVGMSKAPVIAKSNLRNVPEWSYWGCATEFYNPSQPCQWFFKK